MLAIFKQLQQREALKPPTPRATTTAGPDGPPLAAPRGPSAVGPPPHRILTSTRGPEPPPARSSASSFAWKVSLERKGSPSRCSLQLANHHGQGRAGQRNAAQRSSASHGHAVLAERLETSLSWAGTGSCNPISPPRTRQRLPHVPSATLARRGINEPQNSDTQCLSDPLGVAAPSHRETAAFSLLSLLWSRREDLHSSRSFTWQDRMTENN